MQVVLIPLHESTSKELNVEQLNNTWRDLQVCHPRLHPLTQPLFHTGRPTEAVYTRGVHFFARLTHTHDTPRP